MHEATQIIGCDRPVRVPGPVGADQAGEGLFEWMVLEGKDEIAWLNQEAALSFGPIHEFVDTFLSVTFLVSPGSANRVCGPPLVG